MFVSVGYALPRGRLLWSNCRRFAIQKFRASGLAAFTGFSILADPISPNLTNDDWSYGAGIARRSAVITPGDFSLSGQTRSGRPVR